MAFSDHAQIHRPGNKDHKNSNSNWHKERSVFAGRDATCKYLVRCGLNFLSLGPLWPQTLPPFLCSTLFSVQFLSAVPRSGRALTKRDLLPTYPFLQTKVLVQPQKNDVRKKNLSVCAWQPERSSLRPASLPKRLVLISVRGTRNTDVLIQCAKPQHLPILILFLILLDFLLLFTVALQGSGHVTLTHVWLNSPQVQVFLQESLLKNDPTL